MAALATRLVLDPDFHDDVLEWVAEHLEDEEDEDDQAWRGPGRTELSSPPAFRRPAW